MILSFSESPMVPMIEAGLRQRGGADIGDARVKRQTIRPLGPRADLLLRAAAARADAIPYDLHLWWKSRTPERRFIGVVDGSVDLPRVYRIEILHSRVEFTDGRTYQCLRIVLPRSWSWRGERRSDLMFWSPGDEASAFEAFARADGFDSVEAFRDYFVPTCGDRFNGILFEW